MRTPTFTLLALLFFLITACSLQTKEKQISDKSENIAPDEIIPVIELAPLISDTIAIDETDFGEIIELKGQQKVLDCEPFKPGEPELWIKDDYLLMQNLVTNGFMYMLFRMPDFEYITSFGVRGKGPDEFLFPHIVPTSQENVLAYIHESKNDKLYKVDYDGNYSYQPIQFEKVKNAVRSEKQIFAAADNTYYYAEYIRQGKALFKAQMIGDSLHTEQLYNLAFSPKHKSWSAYIGDFEAHPEAKRLVYAYKYFKRILFFDPETKAAKVIDFNKDGVVAANDIITLGPDNVTYYWGGISATDDYIFITYSGRTPIQVVKETGKSDGYIFVEQFDWNGNPIRKYKLDHWGGPVYADGKTNKLYQICYLYDDPLFIYDLPK